MAPIQSNWKCSSGAQSKHFSSSGVYFLVMFILGSVKGGQSFKRWSMGKLLFNAHVAVVVYCSNMQTNCTEMLQQYCLTCVPEQFVKRVLHSSDSALHWPYLQCTEYMRKSSNIIIIMQVPRSKTGHQTFNSFLPPLSLNHK